MRIYTVLTGVACIVALTACSPSPQPAPVAAPPKIVFTDTTYDFGRHEQGTAATHRFPFRNLGGLDLTIDNVRASCACTAVTASKVIPPNAEGSIEVTFDCTDPFGQTSRTITVYSNDPAQPVTTLTVTADIAVVVAADPPKLYVGHVRRGETVRSRVRVLAPETATLGPVMSTGAVMNVVLEETVGTPPQEQIRVTIRPDAPVGPFRDSIRIHTSNARRPVLVVPVRGTVDAAPGEAATHERNSQG